MKKYIIKRFLQLIPILIGITLLSFILMQSSSMDAVDVMEQNTGGSMSDEEKAAIREELGLDKPIPEQYIVWLGGILSGDMGISYVSGQPVFTTFISKLPATIALAITSVLLTVIISIPLGIISAVKQNRLLDYLIRFLSFIGNSLPNFFVSLLLIYFFSLKLRWFPVMGNDQGWKSIILPTLTLALAMASKNRPVPAAHLSFMAKFSTVPSLSTAMPFTSCPPMSMMAVTLGSATWTPMA